VKDINKIPINDILYRPKIKLHGSNVAIVFNGKDILFQSRNNFINVVDDNYDFVKLFRHNEWVGINDIATPKNPIWIYGEWAGPNIMATTAICHIPEKHFFIFSIQRGDDILIDPTDIEIFLNDWLPKIPTNVKIIPWFDDGVVINFSLRETMEVALQAINQNVLVVEREDPYVLSTFGISGIGEGLVYYPESYLIDGKLSRDKFERFVFKAKGKMHSVVLSRDAAQMEPDVINNARLFAKKFVTPERCKQAVVEACKGKHETKMLGPFLGWIGRDIKKESKDEFEASGLDWKPISMEITILAREWFLQN
jgi:hypothetical protein